MGEPCVNNEKKVVIILKKTWIVILTLLLVVMVFNGADRLTYAVDRFAGSLAGAAIALAVTYIFTRLMPEK